jgi:hypothetical protein
MRRAVEKSAPPAVAPWGARLARGRHGAQRQHSPTELEGRLQLPVAEVIWQPLGVADFFWIRVAAPQPWQPPKGLVPEAHTAKVAVEVKPGSAHTQHSATVEDGRLQLPESEVTAQAERTITRSVALPQP